MNPKKLHMDNNDPLTPTPDDNAPSPVLCDATMASLREEGAAFLIDLIDLFVTEAPTRLVLLDTAIVAGDRPTTERAAHTLKSTAAIFGADTMASIAAAMELAAHAGALSEVAQLLPPLRTATEQVRLALLTERKSLLSSHVA